MSEVMYCTYEEVASALDVPETSRSRAQIIREIQGSSRGIEGDTLRYFYPSVSTQTFDWPDHQYAAPWRLWLDERELAGPATAVLAAGTDITASVLFRPDGAPLRGRPFTHIEINLGTNAAFAAGSTFQRSISVTGPFGYCMTEQAGGTMVSAFTDAVGTTGTVSDSSVVGIGSILRLDSERMIVTGKASASTGQTLTTSPAANTNATVMGIQSGAAVNVGETITVDAERMLVTDITGNNLIVLRAWDGTVLAQHAAGATVYASRLVTVERGVLGTTAATHTANTAIAVHVVPSLIRDLCVADTLNTLTQSRRGYTQVIKRTASTGASPSDALEVSTGLDDLRQRVLTRYARIRTQTAARLI